jgi:hypothetical protein
VVETAFVHPFAFVKVYVINADPAEIPVISPVIEFTVAMDALALVQTPPAVALDKVVVEPTHVVLVPVIAVSTGSALTFTVVCEDTVDAHPATEIVYVITVLPPDTPVTTPLAGLIKAIALFAVDQDPPVVVLAKEVVEPTHTSVTPKIVGATGSGLTVTVVETELTHPKLFVTVYVIVVVPAAIPDTMPEAASIVAIAALLDVQTPPEVVLVSAVVEPTQTEVVPVMAATTGNGLIVTEELTELVHPFVFVNV